MRLRAALLGVEAGQAIGSVRAHGFVDIAFEHGAQGTTGTVMHAIAKLEIADREFGVSKVGEERIERAFVDAIMLVELGIESFERGEIVALMRVKERLPK